MAGNTHVNAMTMTLGMLTHMPWYHYLLMALAVAALGVAVHARIRRTYRPRHGVVGGGDVAEHALILVVVELAAMVVLAVFVSGGMLAYHLA